MSLARLRESQGPAIYFRVDKIHHPADPNTCLLSWMCERDSDRMVIIRPLVRYRTSMDGSNDVGDLIVKMRKLLDYWGRARQVKVYFSHRRIIMQTIPEDCMVVGFRPAEPESP